MSSDALGLFFVRRRIQTTRGEICRNFESILVLRSQRNEEAEANVPVELCLTFFQVRGKGKIRLREERRKEQM